MNCPASPDGRHHDRVVSPSGDEPVIVRCTFCLALDILD